jgi:ABC-type iron transport system FetAB permease component
MWAAPAAGLAAMAAIETVAALEDESDEAVTTAVERAVQAAVRGAVAMGLPVVEVRAARVLPGMVTVQVLARAAGSSPFEEELEGPAGDEAPTR